MKILRETIFLGLLASASMAHAGGSANVICDRLSPALEVTYTTGGDAGVPGLFWIGVLTSNQSGGVFYSAKGWEVYNSGLYPYSLRYDTGLPRTIKMTLPFPGGGYTTREYVGYTVFTGNGVYTQAMREQVRERRETVNLVKPDMVAQGLWRAEFGSDDNHMLALVQHDMTMNKKYGMVYTIPFLDCNPSDGGGG